MGFKGLENKIAVPEAPEEKPEKFASSGDNASRVPKNIPEKIISKNPHLRNIFKVLNLLHAEELPSGERVDRKELPEKIKPWENGLELSDNIREVVRDYTIKKIPSLKEKISSINDLPDRKLLEALSNNWFEEIGDEVGGQRREVLLAVAAHMVNHIENKVYEKVLEKSSEQELAKLNLTPELRDLTVRLLQVCEKADPLFIRFLAASQLTPKPPETKEPLAMKRPGDEKEYTPALLFPHETQFISKGFSEISAQETDWKKYPGGEIFRDYIQTLSEVYQEADPAKITDCRKQAEDLYKQLLRSGFPIIVTSAMEDYYKPPYLDPELRVSILTPEAQKEELSFQKVRNSMAENLDVLDISQSRDSVEKGFIRNGVAIGSFGVNLTFNAVAQGTLLYFNEQIRAYDKPFPLWTGLVANSEQEFANLEEEEKIKFLEELSRLNTVMHEISHDVYPESPSEQDKDQQGPSAIERFGKGNKNNFMEISAEIIYRGMIPEMIERGGLSGTKEQWAIATLVSSLQQITDDEGSEYRSAAIYSLNKLFKEKTVELSDGRLVINDFDRYYETHKELARELIRQFEDAGMNEKKAKAWFKENCTLGEDGEKGEELKEVDELLNELVEFRKTPDGKEAMLVRISNISESDKEKEATLDRIENIEKVSFPEHMQTDREGLKELLSINDNIHFIARDIKTKEDLAYLSAIPAEEEADSLSEHDRSFKPEEGEYYLESVSVIPTKRGQRVFAHIWEKFMEEAREKNIDKISLHARKGLSEILQKKYHLKPVRTIENWQGWGEPFDFYEITH
jgi:hypothetical protein